MLFLAMSCFQTRPMKMAWNDLINLKPDGIQLTPGNKVSDNFQQFVGNSKIPYRFHHSFCWNQYKREVYDNYFLPINIEYNQSIHPPEIKYGLNFKDWIENVGDVLLEVMYPEYLLGNSEEIEIAMLLRKRLAIDISHLYIQKTQGILDEFILKKLLNYDLIEEIHISQNGGRFDSHKSITKDCPFLDWVGERKDVEVKVYESYLHKLSFDDRRGQIDFVRKVI